MTEPEQWAVELLSQALAAPLGSPKAASLTIQRAFEERERKRVRSAVDATIVLHHLVDWLESDPKAIHDLRHELGPDGVARVLAALAPRQDAPVTENSHDH